MGKVSTNFCQIAMILALVHQGKNINFVVKEFYVKSRERWSQQKTGNFQKR